MRKAITFLAPRPALATLATLFLVAGFLAVRAAYANILDGDSTPLNPQGKVYEVNPDADGKLWISDLNAGELRGLDPLSDSFTIYPLGMQVSDARQAADDTVWWANYEDSFGSLDLEMNAVSLWRVTGAQKLSATALDEAGLLWLNDVEGQNLYRFDPQGLELCAYQLPEEMGPSDYLLAASGQVWSADRKQPRLLRLTFGMEDTGNLTTWDLPAGSYPVGLARDQQGRLLWADEGLGALGSLDPADGTLRIYPLQTGFKPEMLAAVGSQIWFSEHILDLTGGRIGLLDPSQAVFNETSLQELDLGTVTPNCTEIVSESTTIVEPQEQMATWSTRNYMPVQVAPGLTAYRLPEGGLPWGIAAGGEQVWVAVQGLQFLLRLERGNAEVYLPFLVR
jgi:streptogramin lyase